MYIFLWIFISLLIGIIGSNKKVGFVGAFLISLLLSPIIGVLILLFLPNKEDENKKVIKEINNITKEVKPSIVDEMKKLNEMRSNNQITEEDYFTMRKKILE